MRTEASWSKETIDKFSELYPVTRDKDLVVMFGMSRKTVGRVAKRLGLVKDEEYLLNSRRRGALIASMHAHANPESLSKKVSNTMLELYRKERLRIKWGLPQKTKIKLGKHTEMSWARHNLRKHGYIVPKCSRDAYIVLGVTKTSASLEKLYADKFRFEFETIVV